MASGLMVNGVPVDPSTGKPLRVENEIFLYGKNGVLLGKIARGKASDDEIMMLYQLTKDMDHEEWSAFKSVSSIKLVK